MGLIRGKVTSAAGAGLERMVRAYRRDTGALVAETMSALGTGGDAYYALVGGLYNFDEYIFPPYIVDSGPLDRISKTRGSQTLSTSEKKFGASSLALAEAENSQFFGIPMTDAGTYSGTSAVFTQEGWFRTRTVPAGSNGTRGAVMDFTGGATAAGSVWYDSSTGLFSINYDSADTVTVASHTGTHAVPVDTWAHLALVKGNKWVRFFVDGQLDMMFAVTENGFSANWYTNASMMYFGATGAYLGVSHIDSIRLTRAERYSATFTPPTEPFPAYEELSGGGLFTLDTLGYAGECLVVAYGGPGENATVYDWVTPV